MHFVSCLHWILIYVRVREDWGCTFSVYNKEMYIFILYYQTFKQLH